MTTQYIRRTKTGAPVRQRWRAINAFLLLSLCRSGVAIAAESVACPPGGPIQWIADYCMAKIGTDDEIAASDCISTENNMVSFRSACTAKLHFKRALCEVVVGTGARLGTVDSCVADEQFVGHTVQNGLSLLNHTHEPTHLPVLAHAADACERENTSIVRCHLTA
jgi:hypothetical protein